MISSSNMELGDCMMQNPLRTTTTAAATHISTLQEHKSVNPLCQLLIVITESEEVK
jgi:hypothetical protein